jgi:serine/threonine-protein kinase
MSGKSPSRNLLAEGRYEVLAKLGEGGMGVVYKARDHNLGTDVVIKMPHRHALKEPGFAERFEREVRALCKLTHLHVVKVTDVGRHNGIPFAVLQYLPGGSLEDRRVRDADGQVLPADPRTLAGWLPGVAEALDFVHRRGYLHPDVKPANILFDDQGHPYLSDFGVVKVLAAGPNKRGGAALTGAGMVLGTPAYMAPELIRGEKCDGRADQYALAAAVYELLAGDVPFPGATPAAILVKQTTEDVTPLHQVNPAIPAELGAAVERGLAKDPAQRYASCAELAQAVLAVAVPGSATSTATPMSPAPAPASWSQATPGEEPVRPGSRAGNSATEGRRKPPLTGSARPGEKRTNATPPGRAEPGDESNQVLAFAASGSMRPRPPQRRGAAKWIWLAGGPWPSLP